MNGKKTAGKRVLHQGKDILTLVGTTKKKRMEDYLKALNINLSGEELRTLDRNFPKGSFSGSRYPEQQMGMVVY